MRILIVSHLPYKTNLNTSDAFSKTEVLSYQQAVEELNRSEAKPFDILLSDIRIPEKEQHRSAIPVNWPLLGFPLAMLAAAKGVKYIGLAGADGECFSNLLIEHIDSSGNIRPSQRFKLNDSLCVLLPTKSSRERTTKKPCVICKGEKVCQACKNSQSAELCGRCYGSLQCSDCDGEGFEKVYESDPWVFSWNQEVREMLGF